MSTKQKSPNHRGVGDSGFSVSSRSHGALDLRTNPWDRIGDRAGRGEAGWCFVIPPARLTLHLKKLPNKSCATRGQCKVEEDKLRDIPRSKNLNGQLFTS